MDVPACDAFSELKELRVNLALFAESSVFGRALEKSVCNVCSKLESREIG